MTIHHDKLAYGKLAPESEGLSEERIAQMLAEINGGADEATDSEAEANAPCAVKAQKRLTAAYPAPNYGKSSQKRKK